MTGADNHVWVRVPDPDDEGLPVDVPEFDVIYADGEVTLRCEDRPGGEDADPVIGWMSPAAAMRLAARLQLAAFSESA